MSSSILIEHKHYNGDVTSIGILNYMDYVYSEFGNRVIHILQETNRRTQHPPSTVLFSQFIANLIIDDEKRFTVLVPLDFIGRENHKHKYILQIENKSISKIDNFKAKIKKIGFTNPDFIDITNTSTERFPV